ncbi:MAG: TRAM domain-containing protein [Patescibacteria group bacterium]|nr:TRAM domain-containing protein [Patescibacteria group bacterium]
MNNNLSKQNVIVYFEKIGHNGVSIGKLNGKVVFAYGVLPGEKAKIRIIKENKRFILGEVIEIIEKSPYRVKAQEDHYLSCSPWQVFNYDYQIEIKKSIFNELITTFLGREIVLDDFFKAESLFGYRTKIEYSFKKNDIYHFAFYRRGSYRDKIVVKKGCSLIDNYSNEIAVKILDFVNRRKIVQPKSLIIRRSINYDQRHFSLLISEKQSIKNYEEADNFVIAYSDPQSPSSKFDQILLERGNNFLREKILDKEFRYHYASFFQNNIFLFEKSIQKMREFIKDKMKRIIDLYCGVGVIGILLSDLADEVIGLEIDPHSCKYAVLNAEINGASNFKIINLPSEKIDFSFLEETDLLVVDPPRSGINPKLVKKIVQYPPYYLFYLSCNPLTQIRDISLLSERYSIVNMFAFDFYPNTPHFETLAILERN